MRILVIDDEPLMVSAISRVLADHDVVTLTSGRVAMDRIASDGPFDVILCDVMMPEFSGIDLYQRMARETPQFLNRLVFITGGAYTSESVDFLDRVSNARLEKPILPQVLRAIVAAVAGATSTEKS